MVLCQALTVLPPSQEEGLLKVKAIIIAYICTIVSVIMSIIQNIIGDSALKDY